MQTQTRSQKSNRKPQPKKTLSEAVYAYCEKSNARHAKTEGRKLFGSSSAYINALIAKDRGVKPKLGIWKANGESELLRTKKRKH